MAGKDDGPNLSDVGSLNEPFAANIVHVKDPHSKMNEEAWKKPHALSSSILLQKNEGK